MGATSPELLPVRLRELAEQAARAGGTVAHQWFRRDFTVRRKPDGSEVTDADQAAQAAVLACLGAARPDDAVIAEESVEPNGAPEQEGPAPASLPTREGTQPRSLSKHEETTRVEERGLPAPTNDALCWIIDPLDGTRNFVCGVPIYVCSVAAMLRGMPVVGAIYNPERDELYSVSTGEAVRVNGRPVRTAHRERSGVLPRKPLVGIPSSLSGAPYAVLQGWAGRVVVRNLGSTALHLAMVALGQLDAALVSDSKLWDIAAGWLMVAAGKGIATLIDGKPIFPLDVCRYRGESIPSLVAHDATTHTRLLARDS